MYVLLLVYVYVVSQWCPYVHDWWWTNSGGEWKVKVMVSLLVNDYWDCFINWLFDELNISPDRPTDWLTDWLIEWMDERLIDWIIIELNNSQADYKLPQQNINTLKNLTYIHLLYISINQFNLNIFDIHLKNKLK